MWWASVRSSGSSPQIRQSRRGVRQSGERLDWEDDPSISMTSSPAKRASTDGVGSSADGAVLAPEPKLIEGSRRSLENMSSEIVPRVDAILATSSTSSLYHMAMWLSSRPRNLSSSLHTLLQYASIFRSWQLEAFITWSMTCHESPRTSRHHTLSSMEMRRPLLRASYSATLLVVAKWIWMMYRMWTPRGEMKSRPVPAPFFMRNPSMYIV